MNSERAQKPVTAAFGMLVQSPVPNPGHAGTIIPAFLRYTPQDPFAVSLAFRVEAQEGMVTWIVGRDLIRDGLIQLTGEGDVQIGPDSRGTDSVIFRLEVGHATATLIAPRQQIDEFLRRTAEAVPYGRETAVPGYQNRLESELVQMLLDC
ncbi:SsgA family sporulation/cell division regulator [Streptomyces sp. NPDC054865]